jgi:hypothetical protein
MTTFSKEAEFENAVIEKLIQHGWAPEILKNPSEAELLADCDTAGCTIQENGFANGRASGGIIEGGCGKLTISHDLA